MTQLKGKNAIVTGSTSGIGHGIAEALAEQGANVMLGGFGDAVEIEKLREGLEKKHKVKVRHSAADMTKPAEIRRMVQEAAEAFDSVDILVNNAGIQFVSPIEEFPEEKWDAILAIDLSSSFHTIKASLPHMKRKNWGRIIP